MIYQSIFFIIFSNIFYDIEWDLNDIRIKKYYYFSKIMIKTAINMVKIAYFFINFAKFL